jgi:hypothetical protein
VTAPLRLSKLRDAVDPTWQVLSNDDIVIGQVVGREAALGFRELPRKSDNIRHPRAGRGRLYVPSTEGAELAPDDREEVERWLRFHGRKKTTRITAARERVRAYQGTRVDLNGC